MMVRDGEAACDDDPRPLRGRVVVVTRPREQAQTLVASFESLGAEVLLAPTIEIVATPLDEELRGVLRHLGTYDLIIFSSANAVRQFSDRVVARRCWGTRPWRRWPINVGPISAEPATAEPARAE
jgi:hypothetical protein